MMKPQTTLGGRRISNEEGNNTVHDYNVRTHAKISKKKMGEKVNGELSNRQSQKLKGYIGGLSREEKIKRNSQE